MIISYKIKMLETIMAAKQSYIDSNGRLAIPISLRQQMQLKPGDKVDISFTEEGLLVSTYHVKLARARKIMREHFVNISLVDELIGERRLEATKENAELNDKYQLNIDNNPNEQK